jgi:pilus assembly protein Flp/PilA
MSIFRLHSCPIPENSTGTNSGGENMTTLILRLYVRAQIFREDHGQDLIEYALTAALIALAATAGMNVIASDINIAFSSIGSKLTAYTT